MNTFFLSARRRRRAYAALLRLYPRDFRARFATEMLSAFEEAVEERRGLAELRGLPIGIIAEWVAKLTTDPSIRARTLPDWVKIRPPGVSREAFFGGTFWR